MLPSYSGTKSRSLSPRPRKILPPDWWTTVTTTPSWQEIETDLVVDPWRANRQNPIRDRLMTTTPVTPHNPYRADGKRTQPGAYSTSKRPETLMSSCRGVNVQLISFSLVTLCPKPIVHSSHRSDDMDIVSGSTVEHDL